MSKSNQNFLDVPRSSLSRKKIFGEENKDPSFSNNDSFFTNRNSSKPLNKDLSPFEAYPLPEVFSPPQIDQLSSKILALERELVHSKEENQKLKEELVSIRQKDQKYSEEAGRVPTSHQERKIKELLQELAYWRDRFGASELKIKELSILPSRMKKLEMVNGQVITEIKNLQGSLKEKDDAINFLAQQKAKMEGEMIGNQGFVSRVNELESINKGLMEEIAVWKKKSDEIESNWKNLAKNEEENGLIRNKNEEKDQKISLLTGEIQRLSGLLQEKKSEIDILRVKCLRIDEIQIMYQKEKQGMEDRLRRQRQTLVESVKKEYQEHYRDIESKYEALAQKYQVKELEVEELKHKIADLKIDLLHRDDLEDEINTKASRINLLEEERETIEGKLKEMIEKMNDGEQQLEEYENKIFMLTTEIQKLNQMLIGKTQENDAIKLKIGQLESKIISMRDDYEGKSLAKNKEIEQYKIKIKNIESEKAQEIKKLELKLEEFAFLAKKQDRSYHYDLPINFEGHRQSTRNRNMNNMSANSGRLPHNYEAHQRPDVLNASQASEGKRVMRKEMNTLDEKVKILEEDNDHSKKQADLFKEEAEKLEMINDDLKDQIEELKRQLMALQNRPIPPAFQQDITALQEKNQGLLLSLEQLNTQPNLLHHMSSITAELDRIRIENDRLRSELQREAGGGEEIDHLRRELEMMRREEEDRRREEEGRRREVEDLKRKVWEGDKDKEREKERVNESRRYVGNEGETAELRRVIDDWRFKYQSLEASSHREIDHLKYEGEIRFNRMESELRSLLSKTEVERRMEVEAIEHRWKTEYERIVVELRVKEKTDETYEARSREYEAKIMSLSEEIEKLRSLLSSKSSENSQILQRLSDLSLLSKEELQNTILNLKQILEVKLFEHDTLSRRLSELNALQVDWHTWQDEKEGLLQENERLREEEGKRREEEGRRREEEGKRRRMEEEIGRLAEILEQKLIEIEEWRERCGRMERKLGEKEGLEAKCLDLEDKVRGLGGEVERLMGEVRRKAEENEGIWRKVREVEERAGESGGLRGEVGRLKGFLEDKMKEIDVWKSKYSRIEAMISEKGNLESRFLEIQDKNMTLSSDLEKLSLAFRQKNGELETVKQANRQLQSQITDRALLEQEIMKLKGILEGKLGELEEMRGERGAFEYKLAQKSDPDAIIRDREEKLRMLASELTRLSGLLQAKNEEVESLRLNISKFEMGLRSTNVLQSEIQRLKEILESKMREIDDHKARITKYELFFTENGQMSGQLRESEMKIQRLCGEMEKMSQTIIQKNEEIEVLRLRHQQSEVNRRDEDLFKQEINRIRDILEKKLTETDNLKSKNSDLELMLSQASQNEGVIREWQGKAEACGRQVEKITEILKQKMNELEECRLRYNRLESTLREREAMETEIEKLKEILGSKMREIDDLKGQTANMEVLMSENRALREKMVEGERRMAGLGREMENLGNALKEKVEEVDDVRLRMTRQEGGMRDGEVMQREMQRMKDLLTQKLSENDEIRRENSRLEYILSEKAGIDNIVREYDSKISLLTAELEKLSRLLREKTIENDGLKAANMQLQGGYRDKEFMETELGKIKEALEEKLRELDEYRQKSGLVAGVRNELRNKDNHISSLTRELDKLNSLLREKNVEIDALRNRLAHYDNRPNERERGAHSGYNELEKSQAELVARMREVEDLRERLREFEKSKNEDIEKVKNICETRRITQVDTINKANASQLEDLKQKLRLVIGETEDFKFKLHKYESVIIPSLEEENKALKKQLDDQSYENLQIIEGFKSRIQLIKEELEANIRLNASLKIENERLAGSMSKKGGEAGMFEVLRKELRDYQDKYENLIRRVENMKRIIEQMEEEDNKKIEENFLREIEIMRNKMQELVRENEMLKRREGGRSGEGSMRNLFRD